MIDWTAAVIAVVVGPFAVTIAWVAFWVALWFAAGVAWAWMMLVSWLVPILKPVGDAFVYPFLGLFIGMAFLEFGTVRIALSELRRAWACVGQDIVGLVKMIRRSA